VSFTQYLETEFSNSRILPDGSPMLFKSVKCLLLNDTNYIIRSGPKFQVENMAQLFEYNSENNAFKVTGRVHNSIKFGTDRQTCLCLLHSRLEGRGMRQIDPDPVMQTKWYLIQIHY